MGWDGSPTYRAWIPTPPLHSEKSDWSWRRSGTARDLLWCPKGMGEVPPNNYLFPSQAPPPSPCSGFPPFPTQESSILLSIESLGQTLLGSVAGVPHNALEKAAWTVAVRTEAVIRRHCRTSYRVCVLNPTSPPFPGLYHTNGLRLWAQLGPTDLMTTHFPHG